MSDYEVSRTTTVEAPPERVHPLVEDFRRWVTWSPWEGVDPELQRTYTGADSGVGSRYAWSGNRKAGKGTMQIVSSTPERVGVDLSFEKPFPSTSHVAFELTPVGTGTSVTWRMTGSQKGVAALFGKVVPMDKLVGKDLERGLAQLKAEAEKA